ncbi:MAG: ElyC/SanA/YdcF family protein [Bacteroidota bacterium]
MRVFRSKMFRWFAVLLVVTLVAVFACYKKVSADAVPYLYSDVKAVPYHKAALLLGTSRYLSNGWTNQYFQYRIDAAVELYKAGKVKYIIASGDNSRKEYSEPEDMKLALMENGIPDSAIVLDYAGFRTFDSIIRGKEIFGQSAFIIISQPFHNERAVYIARHNGIAAVGYNAKDVTARYGFKTRAREVLARVKLMLDVHILGTEPKFGGEKIELK